MSTASFQRYTTTLIIVQTLLLSSSANALDSNSARQMEPVGPPSSWHFASQLVVDYKLLAESSLIFRVANLTNATLQSAYWAQSRACTGQGARLLHRDLLLSPAVLRLMLRSFGLRNLNANKAPPIRFLLFADDSAEHDQELTSVWTAEWLPETEEATFQQLQASADSGRYEQFHPVHLCHKPLLPMLLSGSLEDDLRDPLAMLSIGSTVLCCLLLCLMLWAFVSISRQLGRLQRSLTFSYRALDGWASGSSSGSGSNSGGRVRYNGSTSLIHCTSIEARLEHERRIASFY